MGPKDAFFGDAKKLVGKTGTLARSELPRRKWLSGRFTFDDHARGPLEFFQIHVLPIEPWD